MSLLSLSAIFAGCNGGVEEEATPVPSSEPTGEPTGLQYADSYLVAGEVQTLFSSGDDLWVISRFAGQYGSEARFELQRIVGDSYQIVASLPHADQRSYSWTGPVQIDGDEIIAALYTSNAAFSPQDGTHHGVIFFDNGGNLIADHDLYETHGVTGPSGFVVDPETQNIYVLVNNSGNVSAPDEVVDFGSSAIIEITDPYREDLNYRKIPLDGFKNASAIAFRNGRLIVAAAENTLDETADDGWLLQVDPSIVDPLSSPVENIIDIPKGVGMNGNAPASRDGDLVFTGNNEAEGRSLAVLSPDDVMTAYLLPDGFQSYVPGAQPVGSKFLFNVAQGFGVQTFLLDPDTDDVELLNDIDAQFGIGPVFVGAGTYCDAASGTDISSDGTLLSTITCYQEVTD